jgi:hypothetical protein
VGSRADYVGGLQVSVDQRWFELRLEVWKCRSDCFDEEHQAFLAGWLTGQGLLVIDKVIRYPFIDESEVSSFKNFFIEALH